MSEGRQIVAEAVLAEMEWVGQLARVLTHDSEDAVDLVQETMEVALRAPPAAHIPVRAWLGGVVRNRWRMRARGAVRRRTREREVAAIVEGGTVPGANILVERVQTQQLVAARVLALDEPFRSTILMRFYEGISSAEIARRHDIPAGTVRWRFKRGLDELRRDLDTEFAGDRRRWVAVFAPRGGTATGHGGTGVSAGIKGLLAVKITTTLIILAAVVGMALLASRYAGLWGGGTSSTAVQSRTGANPGAVSETNAAKPRAPRGAAIVSEPPTIHRADPRGVLRLEGLVVDETETPIPGADVAVDSNPPRVLRAGEDGSFVVEGLIPRQYKVVARAGHRFAGPVSLRLQPDSEPVILRARPAGTVLVRVVDRATRAPLSGATVTLRSTLSWEAVTDATGDARLVGVGAGRFALHVSASGFARDASVLWATGDRRRAMERVVALSRGASVSGVVVDSVGKPVGGARVAAVSTAEPFPVLDPQRDGVSADKRGKWTLAAVAEGTYRFTAQVRGGAPASTAPILVDGVHARQDVRVVLAAGGVVRGRVTSASGQPIAAAQVRVVGHGGVLWRYATELFTDDRGEFRAEGLPLRSLDIVATDGIGSSPVTLVALSDAKREARLDLALSAGAVVAGTVVSSDGEPLGDAQVMLEPAWTGAVGERASWAARGAHVTVSDAGGRFRFSGLPGGVYQVRAAPPGASEHRLHVTRATVLEVLDGASNVAVRIVVDADGLVTGKVLLPDGNAPELFALELGPMPKVVSVAADGSFEIGGPAGVFPLVVTGPKILRTEVAAVTIRSGAVLDVGTISVKPGRSISGKVVGPDGTAVSGAQVAAGLLLSGGGKQVHIPAESIGAKVATTDGDGNFSLNGFGPQALVVVAQADGVGRSLSLRLARGGEASNLVLTLKPTGRLVGHILRDGAAMPDVIVIANPIGATNSNFFVTTGPDGGYVFDALAAGHYVVYPMLGGGGMMPKDMFLRSVGVVAGATETLDIDAGAGSVTVEFLARGASGEPVRTAQLFVVSARVDAPSQELLRDGAWVRAISGERAVSIRLRSIVQGASVTVTDLLPGPHTVCVVPFPVDPNDPGAVRRVRERAATLPMKCVWFDVQSGQSSPEVTVEVPDDWLKPL